MKRTALKILVPNFAAPDSFTDNVVHTLAAMGHDARTMPAPAFQDRGRAQRVLFEIWKGYRPQTWSEQESWAVATAKTWQPDLVLSLTLPLRTEVLAELKRCGVAACVAWWGDPPANMRGMGLLTQGWDRIYIKDAAAVRKFRAVDLPAELLHEAMSPDWHFVHRDVEPGSVDELVVAGNYYNYRQILVERLSERGVAMGLYGSRPPRWANETIRRGFRGRFIVKAEKSRIFRAGLACLNSTSLSEGNSLNCRAFEICGAGGLQLVENKPAVAECFEPGREVLTYDSADEIVAHLERARRDPAGMRAIREAGHARALAEHTYTHRLNRILRDVDLTT